MTTLSHPRTVSARPATPTPSPRRVERTAALGSTIDPLRVLRRHVWAIIAAAVVGSILGVAAYLLLEQLYPRYTGSVVFQVMPGLQKSSDVGTMDMANDDMVFRIAQTETYMLTSREVLETALKNPDVQKTDWAQEFFNGGTFNHGEALDELEEELGTGVRRSSNLFTLSWSAKKASDVPVVLNAIAQTYMTKMRQRDYSVYDNNLTLFGDQLDKTQRDLANIDGEIKQLIAASNMNTLDDTRWSSQAFQMQELTKKGEELRTSLSIAQSGLVLVRQQIEGRVEPNPEDRLEAERDMSLYNFSENVNFARSHYKQLRETRNADNNMLQDAERRVRSAEATKDEEVQKIMLRNLQAKATELDNSVKRMQAAFDENARELDRVGATLKDLAGKQSELEGLKSKREYLQEQRQEDMQLISEVRLMKFRLDAARVRSAQQAYTPREPSFPKPEVVIPLTVLLLVGLTVGVAFLRELMDKRVRTASDLRVVPGARVLGSLPDTSDDPTRIAAPELVVRRQPGSVLAESYRQAATAILSELDHAEAQTLLLVGGLPETGTTTVATNFASAAAATGRRVLLVDANFRRPGLGQAMGVSDEGAGLGDVLSNTASLDEAIHDGGDGISVMPAGTPANRVFERLNNGLIDGVLADLRSRYDLIIFDAPPAVIAGDALMLANKLDAAVLVVRANQEQRGLVARMINLLGDTRCQLIGVLLNRPRNIAGGYLKKNYAAMAEYSRNGADE